MADARTFAVANLAIVGIEPNGKRFDILIGIGQPYEDITKNGWRCPLSLAGIDNRLPDLAGNDSFQALCLAINYIRQRLLHTVERGVRLVTVENGQEFEFPLEAYFAGIPGHAT